MSALLAAAVGAVCGILSGFGIGGGSLLMVWLTAAAGMAQQQAQLCNLLYFLPTALGALPFHFRGKQIETAALLPAAVGGCLAAAGGAWIATAIDPGVLRRIFGGFLILVGVRECFFRTKQR